MRWNIILIGIHFNFISLSLLDHEQDPILL